MRFVRCLRRAPGYDPSTLHVVCSRGSAAPSRPAPRRAAQPTHHAAPRAPRRAAQPTPPAASSRAPAVARYDPATSHVVYGQDADLLLLALLCHEPHFVVMREWFDQV
jgi:hypothetical protein